MNDFTRIMALDVGDSRTGIAISDPLKITSQPLKTVESNKAIKEISNLVKEYQITSIIVGLPKLLNGNMGEQANKVHTFINKLKPNLPIILGKQVMVEYWDERLTTKQALKVITGSKLKNRKKKGILDKLSATIILQSYLDSKNHA